MNESGYITSSIRLCTINLTRQLGMKAHNYTNIVEGGRWLRYSGRRTNLGERSKRGSTVLGYYFFLIAD